jgi:hypothetical protein
MIKCLLKLQLIVFFYRFILWAPKLMDFSTSIKLLDFMQKNNKFEIYECIRALPLLLAKLSFFKALFF